MDSGDEDWLKHALLLLLTGRQGVGILLHDTSLELDSTGRPMQARMRRAALGSLDTETVPVSKPTPGTLSRRLLCSLWQILNIDIGSTRGEFWCTSSGEELGANLSIRQVRRTTTHQRSGHGSCPAAMQQL